VKIDGHQEARLTELLGVSAFPTLILASSDGKILGQHVGCADVRTISAFLAKAGPAQELKAAPLARAAAPISGVAWAPNPQFFEQFQPKLDALARKLTADLNKQ
jgi:thioredoxin-like negative regulator of GroEL